MYTIHLSFSLLLSKSFYLNFCYQKVQLGHLLCLLNVKDNNLSFNDCDVFHSIYYFYQCNS